MRRSSWIILLTAGSLLVIATVLYSLTYSERAPAMSQAVATELAEAGRRAVERGDVNALFDLFTKDATVLGRTRADAYVEIAKAMSEMRGNFSINIRNLEVRREGRSAQATFTMDVGQKDDRMDVVYYPDLRMRARIAKIRTPRWWGLFEAESWKVTEIESDPPILPKADPP